MNKEMRQQYLRVIRSERWRLIKQRVVRERGNKCEGCGESGCRLDLHHDTYERLGHELLSDLRLLCRDCHRAEDIFRAERGRQRSEDAYSSAYYWGCVNGYMSRRYGEDWESMYDSCDASEMYYESRACDY